jgi:hypothetical protein
VLVGFILGKSEGRFVGRNVGAVGAEVGLTVGDRVPKAWHVVESEKEQEGVPS